MGLFGKRRDRDDTRGVDPRIAAVEARLAELDARIDRGDTDEPSTTSHGRPASSPATIPLPAPTGPPPRLLDADETDAAIAEVRTHLIRIDEQLALLDRRITSVSTELAAQVDELGNEIAALESTATAGTPGADGVAGAPAAPVDPEVIDALRAAQEKLAAEQARYQIAFREDLAELSDRFVR